jgi:hypothetical protein
VLPVRADPAVELLETAPFAWSFGWTEVLLLLPAAVALLLSPGLAPAAGGAGAIIAAEAPSVTGVPLLLFVGDGAAPLAEGGLDLEGEAG